MAKKKIFSFFLGIIEENRQGIVILLLLISMIGAIVGYRYYEYTKEDPQFCTSCHPMQDAFKSWRISKHRDFPCQKCHSMNILEQNRMLVTYVVKGTGSIGKARSVPQSHGRISPWEACRGCHLSDATQGSVSLRKSYGHAKHVFMQGISCGKCHTGTLHLFRPNEQACAGCHSDKHIHGMGMEGFSCLKCHNYSEKSPRMISSERCFGCHQNVPRKGHMSSLQCFDCHHPHGKIKPSDEDCLKTCHGAEAKSGRHELHMTKAKLHCIDCHKPHKWLVGKGGAPGLCNRCHPMKNPETFSY